MEQTAFIPKQHSKLGAASARRVVQHGLEHRLQVARRAADDTQDLRCGFLSVQRLVALKGELCDIGLCFLVGRGWIAYTTTLLRYGLAAARFSSVGVCSGAPSHCLALAQQSGS